ncbi:MAG: ECF-type sigma factor [Pyrinomonadaceae bacterium]
MASPQNVTHILSELAAGRAEAVNELLPLVYRELHHLAAHYLTHERHDHTLQATALVHEAYLKLVDQREVRWQNRAHFFGVAAQLMRRILVDYARNHLAAKRGGGWQRLTLGAADSLSEEQTVDLIALDDALDALAALDARQARIVELRYFGGLSIEETAEVTALSPATVKREWNTAKAFLRHHLTREA